MSCECLVFLLFLRKYGSRTSHNILKSNLTICDAENFLIVCSGDDLTQIYPRFPPELHLSIVSWEQHHACVCRQHFPILLRCFCSLFEIILLYYRVLNMSDTYEKVLSNVDIYTLILFNLNKFIFCSKFLFPELIKCLVRILKIFFLVLWEYQIMCFDHLTPPTPPTYTLLFLPTQLCLCVFF